MEVMIIDDFMPKRFADDLETTMLGNKFEWFLEDGTVDEYNDKYKFNDEEIEDHFQFIHGFYNNYTQFSPDLIPTFLFYRVAEFLGMNDIRLFRLKANMNLKSNRDIKMMPPHFDIQSEVGKTGNPHYITFLYYVNDSDGDTYIFNESCAETNLTIKERVTPKKNRMVLFDSHELHCGSVPTTSAQRVVINGVVDIFGQSV